MPSFSKDAGKEEVHETALFQNRADFICSDLCSDLSRACLACHLPLLLADSVCTDADEKVFQRIKKGFS